ncbi:MAG: HAD family hydrolase [Patescibacteria group bacterium]
MYFLGFPIEMVILDVDGVILDILGGLRKNLEETASHFKLALEPIAKNIKEITEGKARIKGNARDSVRDIWPHLIVTEITEFVSYFYEVERRCPYALIDGALGAIMSLRTYGIPLALATNNPMKSLRWRLEAVGIDPSWFAVIVTKDGKYFKPHPQTFDYIFERIGVARERTLYVGDLQIDWDMARGASVHFCAVLSGGIPREAFIAEGVPPKHIFNRIGDIIEHIEVALDI